MHTDSNVKERYVSLPMSSAIAGIVLVPALIGCGSTSTSPEESVARASSHLTSSATPPGAALAAAVAWARVADPLRFPSQLFLNHNGMFALSPKGRFLCDAEIR